MELAARILSSELLEFMFGMRFHTSPP